MLKFFRPGRLKVRQTLYLLVGTGFVVAGGLIALHPRLAGSQKAQVSPAEQALAAKAKDNLKTLSTESGEDAATVQLPTPKPSVSELEAVTDSASNPMNPATDSCSLNLDKLISGYNRDVAKEKEALDSSLGFPRVGSMISTKYVKDYNDKISTLFAQYQTEASKANCTFPLKAPSLLPASYPN